MLSGSVKVRVGANDDSHMLGRLIWHYYRDAHDPSSVWSSVISVMAAHPVLREAGIPK